MSIFIADQNDWTFGYVRVGHPLLQNNQCAGLLNGNPAIRKSRYEREYLMGQSDQDLDRLSALLHALPVENVPMTLSELDGYVTGILACPDMIMPSDWLPHVWGETGEANFPDMKIADETIGAVMGHYTLLPKR